MPRTINNRLARWATLLFLLLGTASTLLLIQQAPVAAFSGCKKEAAAAIRSDYEARVVQLVNEERAKNGLPPLKLSADLTASARYHAVDMGADGYFDHYSYDRNGANLVQVCDPFVRMKLWYGDFSAAGENIAAGQQTPDQVMSDWMSSDGHRGNILDSKYTEVGVGFFTNAKNETYWVQDFGSRKGVYPIVLAGESGTTTDRNIPVYVHGSFSEIRLRNDGGTWSEWKPFQNSFTWQIGAGRGDHVVSAEMRGGVGSASTCDKIMLDVPAPAPAPAVEASHKLFLPLLQGGGQVTCN